MPGTNPVSDPEVMLTAEALRELLIPCRTAVTRHDPNDRFMADIISQGPDELANATHVLMGCPQDKGVSRNCGRIGAARGPRAIREQLYKFKQPTRDYSVRLVDLGDIRTEGSLEQIHPRLYSVVRSLLEQEKTVIVMGGGNDISLPDARACAEAKGEITAINVDAHLDMREANQPHSGTPYRMLLEQNFLCPENLHEVGTQPQANSPRYLEQARAMGVHVHTLARMASKGVARYLDELFESIANRPLFAGLDMDSICAADAPGVSAPSPVGLSGRDVLLFADHCFRHSETAVFEITETNPEMDIDDRTAKLAALATYTFLYGWA